MSGSADVGVTCVVDTKDCKGGFTLRELNWCYELNCEESWIRLLYSLHSWRDHVTTFAIHILCNLNLTAACSYPYYLVLPYCMLNCSYCGYYQQLHLLPPRCSLHSDNSRMSLYTTAAYTVGCNVDKGGLERIVDLSIFVNRVVLWIESSCVTNIRAWKMLWTLFFLLCFLFWLLFLYAFTICRVVCLAPISAPLPFATFLVSASQSAFPLSSFPFCSVSYLLLVHVSFSCFLLRYL